MSALLAKNHVYPLSPECGWQFIAPQAPPGIPSLPAAGAAFNSNARLHPENKPKPSYSTFTFRRQTTNPSEGNSRTDELLQTFEPTIPVMPLVERPTVNSKSATLLYHGPVPASQNKVQVLLIGAVPLRDGFFKRSKLDRIWCIRRCAAVRNKNELARSRMFQMG